MKIEPVALWTGDLERPRGFCERDFGAQAGGLDSREDPGRSFMGLTHLAIAVGSEEAVDALADRLQADGYPMLDGPRRTGDGYDEATVLDPDGNRLELTV